MKKQLLSRKRLTSLFYSLCLMLLCVNLGWGQQVIGSFPYMNGGFEGQTAGTLGTTLSSTVWTRQSQSGASSSIVTTSPRTGINYASVTNVTSASRGLQSPQLTPFVAGSTPLANTPYMVQFWVRNAASVSGFQVGTNVNGTTDTNYSSSSYSLPINTSWTKYTIATTTKNITVASSGIAVIGRSLAGTFDVDDVVIYPGTAEDVIAPEAPTLATIPSAAASQQTISWTPPVTGVDGGGYMVVRSSADPTTVPNAKGVYAVGNFVSGTEQVVYLGTNPSFTDLGLTPSTRYYYRIYTVDKAFNYSATSIAVDGTTTAPNYAAEPTTPASGISFANVTSTGFDINWTAGNGTNSLVVVKAASAANTDPTIGSSYTANAIFGSGIQIGTANYVVYNGTSNTVTITGLSKAITYYVKVYTFNGSAGSENYLLTDLATANQITLPGAISSNGTGGGSWTAAGTWVGGVVPTQYDNVTIAGSDVVNVAAAAKCYNLTIPSGAKVWSNTAASTLQIYGTSLACAGTFGDPITALTIGSALTTEFGGNLNISGSGGIYPFKLRPVTAITNIGITFDANVSVTGTGTTVMFDNVGNDNIYYTVNSPRTLNIAANFNTASSSATQSTSNNTLTINNGATVNVVGVLNTNEFAGKTYTANINGTLAVTGTSTLSGTSGGGGVTFNVNGTYTSTGNLNVTPIEAAVAPVINVGSSGAITVNGTADFSSTSLSGYIGNAPSTTGGTFTLGALGTIKFATALGLEPNAGPIRTTTRNFNTGANYNFVGVAAQVPGIDFPAIVNNLTINNAAGVTLGSGTTVSGILNLTSGLLSTGGVLTLADGATIARITGSLSAAPTFGATVNVTYGGTFTTQTGTTTLSNTSVTLSAANANIAAGMPVSGTGIAAGTTVSTISGTALTLSQNATATGTNNLSFAYNTAQTASYEIPTATTVLNNLTINHPAGVTLASDTAMKGILTVTSGTLTTGGLLTLKSSECCTATVAPVGGAISGIVTAERYIPVGQRAYRFLSSPVTTTTYINANWQAGTHITGADGATNGFDVTTGNGSSMFTYNNTTPAWTALGNTNATVLTAGVPYLTYIRGSRSASLTVPPSLVSIVSDAATLSATGTLKTGDVLVSGLNETAGGFSAVGNPYQAQVDMAAIFSGSNATASNLNTGFYYVVDPSLGTKGAYLAVDVTAAATGHISQYLQPGQACFVKTIAAGAASLTFKEIHKSVAAAQTTIFRIKNTAIASIDLTLSDINANRLDVLKVAFDANQSNAVDDNDASKMTNFDESMASSNSGKLLSIEKRAIPTDTDEIPLNITKYRGTSYSIKAEGSGLTGPSPYLFDQFANKTIEIPQDGSIDYAYTVDAAIPASIAADRFKLIYAKTLKTIDNAVTGFALYPNPSKSNSFSVVIPQTMSKVSLTVSNLLGQKLYSQNDLQSGTTVKVTADNVKTSGVYLVSLTAEGKTSTTKWIVE